MGTLGSPHNTGEKEGKEGGRGERGKEHLTSPQKRLFLHEHNIRRIEHVTSTF